MITKIQIINSLEKILGRKLNQNEANNVETDLGILVPLLIKEVEILNNRLLIVENKLK